MLYWAFDEATLGIFSSDAGAFSPLADPEVQANIRAYRERWGRASDSLDLATSVAGGRKFEIALSAAAFFIPEGPEVLKNEEALDPEGRHVANRISQLTDEAEDLIDSGQAVTERARQYQAYVDDEKWYAFFFRGRAIQEEVELFIAQSDDPLLQRLEIRPSRLTGIPDFVFRQRSGEEVILDITSPRSFTKGKALKYLESGKEVIVEIYHKGIGMRRR
jgi:hypothetical protein